MKITYVLPISWGGIPHYTAELANAVSKYCNVAVLKPKDNNDNLFNDRVEILHISEPVFFSRKNMLRSLLSLKTLRNMLDIISRRNMGIINKLKPDLIHFPELYPQTSLFAYVYSINKKYPIVTTLHSTFSSVLETLSLENPIYGALACFTDLMKFLITSDKYIVHSIINKDTLIMRGISPEKIVVIPHGVYTIFNKKLFYNKVTTNNVEKNIVFFGYIKKNKGVKYLIKTIPIISEELKKFKIIIAGEGKLPDCRELKDNKLQSKFEIYNKFIPNEKVFELFQRADVIVLPYLQHYGHSGVLTIAFSFGKPVVVTNVGDFPNLVKDGREGFIVPPKDPKALADAILRILENDKLRKKMGRNSLKKSETLSWENIAKKHLKVYKEVIDRWGERSGNL